MKKVGMKWKSIPQKTAWEINKQFIDRITQPEPTIKELLQRGVIDETRNDDYGKWLHEEVRVRRIEILGLRDGGKYNLYKALKKVDAARNNQGAVDNKQTKLKNRIKELEAKLKQATDRQAPTLKNARELEKCIIDYAQAHIGEAVTPAQMEAITKVLTDYERWLQAPAGLTREQVLNGREDRDNARANQAGIDRALTKRDKQIAELEAKLKQTEAERDAARKAYLDLLDATSK